MAVFANENEVRKGAARLSFSLKRLKAQQLREESIWSWAILQSWMWIVL